MSCETYLQGEAWLRRVDPRLRFIGALAFATLVALTPHPRAALAGLGVGLALALAADLPWQAVAKRLRSLNLLMLTLALLLPLDFTGRAPYAWGPLGWSPANLALAGLIALKANAISLAVTALVSTVEPVHLGQALHRLGAPTKLVQLLVFTLRYMDELEHERHKLADALRVRGFRPHLNRHTLRTYGHALGMLLVGSFDRAERVLAAMRCRGFHGTFHVLDGLEAGARELAFGCGALAVLGTLGWLAWM